jgi:hypothetical protein
VNGDILKTVDSYVEEPTVINQQHVNDEDNSSLKEINHQETTVVIVSKGSEIRSEGQLKKFFNLIFVC